MCKCPAGLMPATNVFTGWFRGPMTGFSISVLLKTKKVKKRKEKKRREGGKEKKGKKRAGLNIGPEILVLYAFPGNK